MKPLTTIQDIKKAISRITGQMNALELSPLFTPLDKGILLDYYTRILALYSENLDFCIKNKAANEIQVTDPTTL